ncbi:Riboflavin biosynthesis protein RibD [Seminavis robusta]|uniref:Riboflavin biosynthesis protein RibD n=1 Tax=Seminavis robusta TaxID=568900 RepID=A0A9N8DC19_9STRA|nr:Riboflavin biosynthesis protein RibD [Seminavis robusta]|eukprot:Sro30_g019570.1 Riboflavin biosynthesis protein RibD (430) ;mRNA; r:65595-66884
MMALVPWHWKTSAVVRAVSLASIVSTSSRLCYSAYAFPSLLPNRRLPSPCHLPNGRRCHLHATSSSSTQQAQLDSTDVDHMNLALECAKKGFGNTYPNPAVGCVLVRQETNQVIGKGFHPRAGYPHAEVFALLEATGHLEDGVKAAAAVVAGYPPARAEKKKTDSLTQTLDLVEELTQQYASENGPEQLLSDDRTFQDIPVTAYVTLEPCCHYGKTPPCAASLVQAKVSRVVVGFRDPNPRVDGGGVQLLTDAGVQVDMMGDGDNDDSLKMNEACHNLVKDFVKRITPREDFSGDYSYVTGAMRRGLRAHASRLKAQNKMAEMVWKGPSLSDQDALTEEAIIQELLPFDPSWLERLDHLLWQNEVVLLRLGKAIKRKKGAKLLGELIAEELEAHVAQTVGHTALLYRPGLPPDLDLEALREKSTDATSS